MTTFTTSERKPTPARAEPSLATLLSGIVADVQELLEQRLQLVRSEMQQDLQTTCRAAWWVVLGTGSAVIAGVGLLFAIAHWLSGNFPSLSFAGSIGLLSGTLAVIASAMIFHGVKNVESCNSRWGESSRPSKET